MSPKAMAPGGGVVIYQSPQGEVQLDVRLEEETVWLTQAQMAESFGRKRSVITKHLRNVFVEGELEQKSNVKNFYIAGSDKPVAFYNLDVLISFGYRVQSAQGTRSAPNRGSGPQSMLGYGR